MSIEKVRDYFRPLGREGDILEFPVSSATVELAAKVYHKVTRTCGGHSSVEYTVMRPKNKDCIQWKLNAWNTKPDLDKAKFIPYSDKAALFFYEMLEGIARLNKRLQDTTSEAENLMKCIEAGTFFLPNNTND